MRLKRVRIFGFKTFADRTEFSLEGGVIAVVGPNGCGKSNLVDAILWGLGEGNSRHLRAATSQDVIFSGSANRKPVGFAEVTLLFDNEDGGLPIETSEVSITRRLTRSGDSEYSINRHPCRLRDIYDLLADSGLGRAGYAIVGQKEIDSALSASAEDRRAWVDEAAGVQRYRARKLESQRRLVAAQEHLSRVADILHELESQREPLREEAEIAQRYKSLMGALREVEVGLLVEEVARAIAEVRENEARLEESARVSQAELARAEALDHKIRETGAAISALEQELDTIRGLQQGSLTALERADANLRLLDQRLTSLDDQEKNLADDGRSVANRITEAEREVGELRQESEGEAKAFEELRAELVGVGEEAKQLSDALKSVERELDEARRRHAIRLRQEAERAHQADRMKLVRREIQGIVEALPELDSAIAEAQAAFDGLSGQGQARQGEIKKLEARIQEIRQEEERDAASVRKALAEKASLEGRKRGIEATIDAHEGLTQGSRAVLEAAERGLLDADYVPVGQAVDTDKEYALAIETALGGSANDLICDDPADAKAGVEWLKKHRAGRATFQPIPLMRPSEASYELKRLLGERGIVGRASELVSCRAHHRPVIDSLLGRVVIVEDIDVALRHARTTGWSRLVTLDGEVVHGSGAVTGGQQARQGYGFVQRKADLAELAIELEKLEKTVGEFDGRSNRRARAKTEAETEIRGIREAIAAEQSEIQEARNFLQTLIDERRSAERSQEKLQKELEVLTDQPVADETPIDLPGLEARRDAAIKALASKSADADQAENRIREAEGRAHQAAVRLQAGERRLQIAREAEEHRVRRLQSLEPDRQKIRAEREESLHARMQASQSKAEADVRLETAQSERRELLEASLKQAEEAKAARANSALVVEAAHQAELGRTRAEARRATALQRLYEEYGLVEEEALAQRGLHEVPADASTVVNRLRRELRSMGDVNLGAIEAFERLNTRFEELEAQQNDVLEGIEQVEASIRELDKLTRERFVSTFLAVEAAFTETFQKLFGGGEGHLALSDPERVLESGIDILITLPGKKRQALQLLSGGERSLSAMAFLFALLKVKPSPLVVLDEVDAPLDGRNVERFAAILQEFTATTQFIVITHNPTTIEHAPVWLGVTMQEPGVSTLVPARLPA
ncbi:chromosome segregation protein SMC [Fimbriimonas ginsengisoli]|uniref:Chromosome partition protein Smc n=1 Tax=Fimbriimonas ginsengisoli Gsoil 348 TaxID=661478 RepID=A0A068NXT7_FIMGI|nr:chromosome segregation protein SMC [Fimbriimonas ginsengisoli]AIE88172.1 Chromosome partition protein smc [Fimbriimonas ginsengisoli Gsoil 348]